MRNRSNYQNISKRDEDYIGLGIDAFSSTALYLELKVNGHTISGATGFLWFAQNKYYLVTNWHVLSGRNQESNECMHSQGGLPDTLTVHFQKLDVAQGHITIDLTLSENDRPLWIEHPKYGREVDLAAIEIDVPDMSVANYIALNMLPEVLLKQRVGHQAFIIGFPFGHQHFGFPVWKKASFATEPFLAKIVPSEPMLVDSASRPGMSGAPVIQREYGQIELENGEYGRIGGGDGACRLVGIYSGRCHTNDHNDAQLGRVWPIILVREMLNDLPPSLEKILR